MHKAIAVKELRESIGIVAVAVLAGSLMLALLTGIRLLPSLSVSGDLSFPFVRDGMTVYLCLLSGGLSAALGAKQSTRELSPGGYYFLLHRPVRRWRIFATKLAVGSSLVLLVSGGFVLAYAAWAALPGRHATPFLWSMTGWAWQLWFALVLLYLGMFLSGIRPGRWFGARLLPLVASVPLAILAASLPWWWLGITVVLLSAIVLVASILHYAATRDY